MRQSCEMALCIAPGAARASLSAVNDELCRHVRRDDLAHRSSSNLTVERMSLTLLFHHSWRLIKPSLLL
jgi:hypothetical protein